MCPVCLATLAVTVATTTGAGAAVTALVVSAKRALTHADLEPTPTHVKETFAMAPSTTATATATTAAHATATAEVVREYVPLGGEQIHGVTFDGALVWFCHDDELVAFDPSAEAIVRRIEAPAARAGTAYDGRHLYQLASGEVRVIDPDTGRVVRSFPAPGKGNDSGMAYADGHLFIGQYRDSKIHKVDAKTGALVKTLSSDRFVTGVSCVGGELWHGASGDGKPCELRRVGADGRVEKTVAVPVAFIAGVERTPEGEFWCAGDGGTLRLVRVKAA